MSERYAGFVVTLAEDLNQQEMEQALTVLGWIRGVVSVQPVAGDVQLLLAQARAERAVEMKIWEALK